MGRRTRTLSIATAALGALLLLVPVAGAEAGGARYATSPAGGSPYGAALGRATPPHPVARAFGVTPARVTAPTLPTVRFRVSQPSARTLSARVVFWPVRGGTVARLDLGRVPADRLVTVRWPAGFAVQPGRYLVRLHIKGRGGQVLARNAGVSGRANLVVVPKPAPPPPVPAPVVASVAPVAPVAAPALTPGIFPVQGLHTYGDGFGAGRADHIHQGQDVRAAEGTPVVAPVAGTVTSTSFQAKAAGYYVVQHADDGRDFFFAHCREGSVVVAAGQRVAAGGRLCDVGSTGDSSGPHLHFEMWVGGWRASASSQPVDPIAQLRAWDV